MPLLKPDICNTLRRVKPIERIKSMVVVPPMPRLECIFTDMPMPETLYHGECALSLLQVTNIGSVSADNIMIRLNRPDMVGIHVVN